MPDGKRTIGFNVPLQEADRYRAAGRKTGARVVISSKDYFVGRQGAFTRASVPDDERRVYVNGTDQQLSKTNEEAHRR